MFDAEKVKKLAQMVSDSFGEGLTQEDVKTAAIMLNDEAKIFQPGDKQFWFPLVWKAYQEA